MEEFAVGHLDEARNDVLGELQHLGLRESALALEQHAEVALVAVLGDDEAVRGFADHIVAPQDVGVLELGQGLDFAV